MDAIESVYYYIADVDPNGSLNVLANYGIVEDGVNPVSTQDIANSLYEIVQTNGEQALVDVMSLHPDKSMILELFAPATVTSSATTVMPAAAVPAVNTNQIPTLPVSGSSMSSGTLSDNSAKPFFSNPVNVMIVGVAVIATIALIKS